MAINSAPSPRIALSDGNGGEPHDRTPEQSVAAAELFPELVREWRKWQGMFGRKGGRLVVVDPEVVARLRAEVVDR
jgi:hypothetical protein